MDTNIIKTKYERLKKNGVARLLSLEKIIDLENIKELIIEKYLKKISDLSYESGLIFIDQINENDMIAFTTKYFGFINFKDIRFENNILTLVLIFDLGQIVINKKNNEISYSVTVYWDT